ncbi:HtaA domain-containing protein [Jongsikchunia kroppenstedtii]|uniref:HtaA domain-containing protein n=1 Tax=Jongsikchunia kroppenstedtii TaxID=1121721 RepID=UPI0003748BAD|nr:HtaA domain-containing protein [Jongsikchunia kroppenstedtii]
MKRLSLLFGLVLALAVGVPATAAAAPAAAGARIAVFAADGVTPLGAQTVRPGDQLVIRGYGFDPNANRQGLPVPVPPGVPHGTFIAFGAFAPVWQPSAGAPEASRAVNRSAMKWALAPSALAQVPDVPFDLRRTVRQQWVSLGADGSFVARITATTPKDIPAGARYGVYTYGAADATNAAQERFVPVNYDPRPGPNTPRPAPADLLWAYAPAFRKTVVDTAQGGLAASDGAGVDDQGRLTFALRDKKIRNGVGTLAYRGTVVAYSRFHLVEFALADPELTVRGGRGVLTMATSTTNMNGTDAMMRVPIADVDLSRLTADGQVTAAAVTFRPGIRPEALALLSVGPAAPLTLH